MTELDQARSDFTKLVESAEPDGRFEAIQKAYGGLVGTDPDLVARFVVNEIRVRPPSRRPTWGGDSRFIEDMQRLQRQLESEASQSAASGNPAEAARKRLYAVYLLEELPSATVVTTDLIEAVEMGAQAGADKADKLKALRAEAVETGMTMSLTVCRTCLEVVADADAHDPAHRTKVYEVLLTPGEEDGVRHALELYLGARVAEGQQTCKACGRSIKKTEWTCPDCGHTQWGSIIGAGVSALICLGAAVWGATQGAQCLAWGGGILGVLLLLVVAGEIRTSSQTRKKLELQK